MLGFASSQRSFYTHAHLASIKCVCSVVQVVNKLDMQVVIGAGPARHSQAPPDADRQVLGLEELSPPKPPLS